MAGSSKALAVHVLLCCLWRGLANLRCSGHVWIEPAPVVRMGSNISINCLSTLGCPWADFLIFLNLTKVTESPLHPLNSSAVQLRLPHFQMPSGDVVCLARCPNNASHRLVCGTSILSGYPPDPPSNLSCSIQEYSGYLACTWATGRPTYLPTLYTLHVRSMRTVLVGNAEEEEEEKVFPAGLPVLLSELQGGNRYLAWVKASNTLGTACSAPQRLDLQELVVPALPLLTGIETMETSPPATILHWKRQSLLENVVCEERHKTSGAPAWQVEVWDAGAQHGPRWRQDLQSDTQYLFQIRCRLSSANSPWSPWSPPFLYSTPEAAPTTAPDVWRRLGSVFPNGSHEVTVLIKPLAPQDARGKILCYVVATESAGERLLLCNTSSTTCRVLVPPGARSLQVTAHNSKGASSPASIYFGRGAGGQEEFPAPVAVEVKPQNQSGVLVTWKPPHCSRMSTLWFIVEWGCSTQYGQEEQYFWKKVSYQENQTYIHGKSYLCPEEVSAGGPITVSVYAVYPHGVSKPSSGQVPPEDNLLAGTYREISHDDDIGLLLGLGISMVTLSVVFMVVMFKKSARHRVNSTIMSVMPKWLIEDFPHLENSNVVKSLQEKSDFMSSSFHEPFLDMSDVTVTEIEEVPEHMEYKSMTTRRKPSREVPEDENHPVRTAPTTITHSEQISDYKPQVSDVNTGGYVAADIYPTQPPTVLPEQDTNVFFSDYTNPAANLWDGEAVGHHVCLLEKINLILNSSQSGQSQMFSPGQGGPGSFLENQWGQPPANDAQEQTLVPDELFSCLRDMNGGESVDLRTCFTQSVGRLF